MRKLIVPITYDAFARLLQADDGVRCVEAHVDDARQLVRLKFEGVGPEIKEGMRIPEETVTITSQGAMTFEKAGAVEAFPKITWPVFE